jgi:hypothetical protein
MSQAKSILMSEASPLVAQTQQRKRAEELRHPSMLAARHVSVPLDAIQHDPKMFDAPPDPSNPRIMRSSVRLLMSKNHDTSVKYALGALCVTSLRRATVFGRSRMILVMGFHLSLVEV